MVMRIVRKGEEWRCLWKNEGFLNVNKKNEAGKENQIILDWGSFPVH